MIIVLEAIMWLVGAAVAFFMIGAIVAPFMKREPKYTETEATLDRGHEVARKHDLPDVSPASNDPSDIGQ